MQHPVAAETERLLEIFHEKRSSWAKQAFEDDQFRNGVQWDDEAEKALEARDQAPIVVNVVHGAVEQAKALLTANKPRFQATGREDSDTRTGKFISDLMTWIWDVSDGNAELKQCIDDYYVRGMGVMCTYFDPTLDMGKGEIIIKALDPLNTYLSPDCKDRYGRDSSDIFLVTVLSEDQVKFTHPYLVPYLKNAKTTTITRHPSTNRVAQEDQQIGTDENQDGNIRRYELIDRYKKIRVKHFHVADSTSDKEHLFTEEEYRNYRAEPAYLVATPGGNKIITDMDEVRQYMEIEAKFGPIVHWSAGAGQQPQIVAGLEDEDPTAIEGSEMFLERTTKAELIKRDVLVVNVTNEVRVRRIHVFGGQLVFDKVLKISEYPIVTFMNRHNRNPYPVSDVRFVKGLQEYVNKIRSLIAAHAASSTNTKLLIPRGAVDKSELEREWSRAGTAVIEFDAEIGVPIVAGPVPLPNELYVNEANARKDIEQALGIFAFQQGDVAQAPQTYKGTVALDEFSQRRIQSKRDDIESSLNQLARVIVEMIPYSYTERKVFRLIRPNNAPRQVEINTPIYDDITGEMKGKLNDITVGRYDIAVVSGSTLPSNRWARFEYYARLYELQLIDQIEVLKQTEVVDIEGVLSRHSILVKLTQQVEQMAQQIKNLEGDLQTAERESVHDRKALEVEKFKARLSQLNSSAQAALELTRARLQDQVKSVKQGVAEAGRFQDPNANPLTS